MKKIIQLIIALLVIIFVIGIMYMKIWLLVIIFFVICILYMIKCYIEAVPFPEDYEE